MRRFGMIGARFLVVFGGGPIMHDVAGLQIQFGRPEEIVLLFERFRPGLIRLRAVQEHRQAEFLTLLTWLTFAFGLERYVPQAVVGIEGLYADPQLTILRHRDFFLTRLVNLDVRRQVGIDVDVIADRSADAVAVDVGEKDLVAVVLGLPRRCRDRAPA